MDRHRLRVGVWMVGRHAHEPSRHPARLIGEPGGDVSGCACDQLRRQDGPEGVDLSGPGIDA